MTSLGLSIETTLETSATMFEPAVSEEEPIQTQTDEQIPNTNIND